MISLIVFAICLGVGCVAAALLLMPAPEATSEDAA